MRPMSAVMTFAVRYFFFWSILFFNNHVQYVCFSFVNSELRPSSCFLFFACLFASLFVCMFLLYHAQMSDPIMFLIPTYISFSLVSLNLQSAVRNVN